MSVETLDVLLRVVFYAMLSVLTYVVVPAIKTWHRSKLTKDQRDTLDYWVDIGVRWAKQWLQTDTGVEKKEKVMQFVLEKVEELGLPYTEDDIDKAIEAVYGSIKDAPDSVALVANDLDLTDADLDFLLGNDIVMEEEVNDPVH